MIFFFSAANFCDAADSCPVRPATVAYILWGDSFAAASAKLTNSSDSIESRLVQASLKVLARRVLSVFRTNSTDHGNEFHPAHRKLAGGGIISGYTESSREI